MVCQRQMSMTPAVELHYAFTNLKREPSSSVCAEWEPALLDACWQVDARAADCPEATDCALYRASNSEATQRSGVATHHRLCCASEGGGGGDLPAVERFADCRRLDTSDLRSPPVSLASRNYL